MQKKPSVNVKHTTVEIKQNENVDYENRYIIPFM